MSENIRASNNVTWSEDPRYRVSTKEFLITLVYFALYTVVTIAVAWAIGGGKSADELAFVFGFPAWFFWSTLVLGLFFCIVPYFIVKLAFSPMSLAPEPEDPDGQPDASQPKQGDS